MHRFYLLVLAGWIITGCGSEKKKPSLSGNDPVTAKEFVESFPQVRLPFEVHDSLFARKEKDSLLISQKIFSLFIPDSVLLKDFGKNAKPRIYMLGGLNTGKKENYLFVKAVQAEKKAAYIFAFDDKNRFMAGMPLLKMDANPATVQVSSFDRRYSLNRNTILRKTDGSAAEGKEVFVFNADAKKFMLIMTEALDDRLKEVINPIDSLQRKNKFSADYVKDKMNIVSIRDGNKPGRLNFFIHFERENGACTGELKGMADMKSAFTAVYRQADDPCELQFSFTSSSVSVKEAGLCGSHRGVKCSFDGFYPRKKEIKKRESKKR